MKTLPRSRSGPTEQYPLATIAAYGPDGTHASKLVVSVIDGPGPRDPTATRAWTTQAVDVRHDPVIADDVASFVQAHGAK